MDVGVQRRSVDGLKNGGRSGVGNFLALVSRILLVIKMSRRFELNGPVCLKRQSNSPSTWKSSFSLLGKGTGS